MRHNCWKILPERGFLIHPDPVARLSEAMNGFPIPAAALGLNFAWEVIYSVHSLSTWLSVQGVINIAWALADVAIVYTFFALQL